MQNTSEISNKLNVKDLISVGLFTAIYFIIFILSTATTVVPIMSFGFCALCALIAGIPMILFFSRIKKYGMVTIMSVLMAIIIFVMGYGPIGAGITLVCGIIADIILKAGKWQSWKHMLSAYSVFSLWGVGTLIPIVMMGNTYFERYRAAMGDDYVEEASAVLNSISSMLVPVVAVLTIICAIIGAYIGKAVLKKHFERAGIA